MKKALFTVGILVLLCVAACVNGWIDTEINVPDFTEVPQSEEHQKDEITGELEVHFIDVGQADCILVKNKSEVMLIDAGNNGDAKLIKEYLKNQDVSKIKYLIGTHPHEDHIGSLDMVINDFDVENVIMPQKTTNTKTFNDVVTALENKKLQIIKPVVGNKYLFGDAEFVILAPAKDYGDDLNEASVVIKVTYGETSFMFTGDAETESETDILNSGMMLKADVLKLGHHGSYTSSSEAFLKAVEPDYGVIMCGKDNDYGHPHKETLEKVEKNNIELYRTDEQGTIIAVSDGKKIIWSTNR